MTDVRILAFAYACEPGKGSEPGAGWAWARILAGLGETWVITRANNRHAIEAEIHHAPESDRLHFVYVDLPPWARSWKRGQRGIRLYYMLWQLAAQRRARNLDRQIHFDLAWHLTLANVWLGSLASLEGRPFIYGPVGGGARTPALLVPTLGARGIAYEVVRRVAQVAGRYLNPVARLAWGRATLILVQNRETLAYLPARHRQKGIVFPNAAIELPASVPAVSRSSGESPRALFAGRLLPWKGVALAIRTIRLLPGWRLSVIGSGPDEARLRRLVRQLGVADRVDFVPTIPREDLLHRMRQDADVFLFPSLHDDGPWVVAEAVLSGLPVVCLDVGGPPLLGGIGVRPGTPARTASALASTALDAATRPRATSVDFTARSRAAAVRRLVEERTAILRLSGGTRGVADAETLGDGPPSGRGLSRSETAPS